ncbi:MAG: cyclic nucleotide-binding domain-containing protein [Candidatus Marinimicrobia bacterium]|nr:cyclic nucleotide-binding domain-containing protein [Candidatus Neomarinimicrobiota bacterium]MDD5583138.1 cyclic nucleotide-binding domain-containing protein [Candidatus Neomarinimicrobiota bacterium]
MTQVLWSPIRKKDRPQEEMIMDALRNVHIFKNLTNKEIKKILSLVYTRKYKKGDYIFKQGHPGNGMYIILNGTIQIIQEKREENIHQEELLATLHSGDFLGELSLLDEAPRSASALCLEQTEALGFFRGDLMDLLNRDPLLGSKIVLNVARVLAERLRITNQQLADLQEKEARHVKEE